MMGLCQAWAAQYRDGEHRLEFFEEKGGIRWDRCLDCGEMLQMYIDGIGG